ncbi:ribosome small subunit-dependent GTPase A [Arcticibacterium luteifluviistationis]|uniref:Small ribosomal subunit biogenesis GTPase RsgA n=1 Tax=Arcticibacterium luteifluviistationis TaxID=1784714 RepID=A0A2Z4GAP8_9BACT|nr:ribosome small subunit-dependent GTPase A [Arcticibacterium luteifluviistationis]AWV98013.1 ribosome small subunit-dependent GTPase A [Arcticibacterium luteifluviistationis]
MKNIKGKVWRSTGSWYEVRSEEHGLTRCRLKGKFKIKGLKVTNPLAVGDDVIFDHEEKDEELGIIHEILPRKNYLIRKSVHKTAHGHLIACNIDQAICVVTLHFPKTSLGFIDRFLVSAEAFRIPAVLLFNKKDLLDEETEAYQAAVMEMYEAIGYPCYSISALNGDNIDLVEKLIENKTSLFSGHSGVGKSHLINRLIPELDQATSEVSTFANKGVHTTTFAEMFESSPNTYIIDSPGIKELGLMEMKNQEISHYFPEMRAFLGQCKFNNCEHTNEPHCRIKDAVGNEEIAESRYISYLSMLENDDNRR